LFLTFETVSVFEENFDFNNHYSILNVPLLNKMGQIGVLLSPKAKVMVPTASHVSGFFAVC